MKVKVKELTSKCVLREGKGDDRKLSKYPSFKIIYNRHLLKDDKDFKLSQPNKKAQMRNAYLRSYAESQSSR